MFAQDFDREAAPQANEGRDLPATFGESFQDAWQSGQDAVSSLKAENARNQAIGDTPRRSRALAVTSMASIRKRRPPAETFCGPPRLIR
jgi:hypothetical protein